MASHADAQTIHKGAYVGAVDPSLNSANKVAAQKLWVDTSGGIGKFVLKVRNDANDDWQKVSGLVLGDDEPQDKQVLAYNGETEQYEPTNVNSLIDALAGDINGQPNATVLQTINGRAIVIPPLPATIGDNFEDNAFNTSFWGTDLFNTDVSETGGKLRFNGNNPFGGGYGSICAKGALNLTGKSIVFDLDYTGGTDNNDNAYIGFVPAYGPANGHNTNMTGFIFKPISAPLSVTCVFQIQDGLFSQVVNLPEAATKMRLRDAAGVLYYDFFYQNAWHTLTQYDYAAANLAGKFLFANFKTGAQSPSIRLNSVETNVFSSDTLAGNEVLIWDAGTSSLRLVNVATILPPAAPIALEGDVTGGEKTTVVQKIRGRNIKNIPLPSFVGDDFEDGALSNLDWYLLGDSDSYAKFTEANGRGKFEITYTPYFKGKDIVGKRNIANLSGKEIVFDFNSFGNGDIIVWLGLRDFGANTPAGAGGQYQPDNNFIGFRIGQNGAISCFFNQTGNSNNVNYQNSAVNGLPKKLRLVDNGAGVLSYDVMLQGSEVWQNCYTHDYAIAAVTDKVLALTFAGAQYQAISWELNQVTTTFALTDELADGSILQWSAANGRWQDVSKADFLADSSLALAGDVTGVSTANNVSKLQGRLLDAPALPNTFVEDFNGTELSEDWTESGSGSVAVSGGKARLTTPASTYEQETITSEFHDFTDRYVIFYPITFPAGGGENYALFRLEFADGANFIYFLARQSDVYVMRAYKTGGAQVGVTLTGSNGTPSKIRFRHNATTNVLTLDIWNNGTNDWELVVNVDVAAAGWDLTQTRFVAGASTAGGVVFLDLTKVESDIPTEAEEDFVLLFTNGKYQKLTLPDLKAALDALP